MFGAPTQYPAGFPDVNAPSYSPTAIFEPFPSLLGGNINVVYVANTVNQPTTDFTFKGQFVWESPPTPLFIGPSGNTDELAIFARSIDATEFGLRSFAWNHQLFVYLQLGVDGIPYFVWHQNLGTVDNQVHTYTVTSNFQLVNILIWQGLQMQVRAFIDGVERGGVATPLFLPVRQPASYVVDMKTSRYSADGFNIKGSFTLFDPSIVTSPTIAPPTPSTYNPETFLLPLLGAGAAVLVAERLP